MKKRLLSLLLCACMVITLLPVTALAYTQIPNLEEGKTLDTLAAEEYMNSNSGTIANNYGLVYDNKGEITNNSGTVQKNSSNITNNNGIVQTNSVRVTVTNNYRIVATNNGTVTTNEGTVSVNNNLVGANNGVVETNSGTINGNSSSGTVKNNYGTIDESFGNITNNYGTVTNNHRQITNNYGIVKQLTGDNGYVLHQFYRFNVTGGENADFTGVHVSDEKTWMGALDNYPNVKITVKPKKGYRFAAAPTGTNCTITKISDNEYTVSEATGDVSLTLEISAASIQVDKEVLGNGTITLRKGANDSTNPGDYLEYGKSYNIYPVAGDTGEGKGLVGLYLLKNGDPLPTAPYEIEPAFREVFGGLLGYDFPCPDEDFTIYAVFFVPVSDVTLETTETNTSTLLTLSAVVAPATATNQTIEWSVADRGTTNAVVNKGLFFATAAGTAKVTATITDGTAVGTNYTKDFTITVTQPLHEHSWTTAWSHDEFFHWHECTAANCNLFKNLPNDAKDGNGGHIYDNDADMTCNICEYVRMVTPPAVTTYTISVNADPVAGGTVHGGGTYRKGDAVSVLAQANEGYRFKGWLENDDIVSENPSLEFMASGDRTLVAIFEAETVEPPAATVYTIAVSADPAEGGTANGSGTYRENAPVTVRAQANDGYHFVKWTESGETVSEDESYTFNAVASRTLVVVFELDEPEPPAFVAVTGLTFDGTPTVETNTGLILSAIVAPANATNKTIVWRLSTSDAGTTGASVLDGVFSATTAGTATVTATIADGTASGTDYTQDFDITVIAAPASPSISVQPTSQSVTEGQTATFSVTAAGNPAPSYQWQVSTNGGTSWNNVSDGTGGAGASYTTPATITAMNGYQYRCYILNSQGNVTSGVATLTVSAAPAAPSISVQPASQNVTEGQTATFSVTATGNPAPSYQWQVSTDGGTGWNNVSDGTGGAGASYTTPATTTAMNGYQYRCYILNSQGNVTSGVATLTVSAAPAAPSISAQPTSQSVTEGQTATFNVTATGNPAPSYQWQVSTNGGTNWNNVSDGTGGVSASYTTPATTTAMNGYQYRCYIVNSQGNATSGVATLTVTRISIDPPASSNTIIGILSGQTYKKGETVTFTAVGGGTDNVVPITNDQRWLPIAWETNPSGNFSTGFVQTFSTADMTLGPHTLTVTFAQQKYNGTAWVDTGATDTKSISFAVTAASYVVTLKPGASADAGQSERTESKTPGTPLPLPGAIYNRNGFTQTGWSETDGGVKAYAPDGSYTTDADATLYPFWTENAPTTHLLTVTNGSGSGSYAEGTQVRIIAQAPQSGMRFTAWSIASGGGQILDPTSADTYYTMPAGDAAVVATFESALQITAEPTDQYIVVGQQATFSVTAAGDGLSYQWYINRNSGRGWRKLDNSTGPAHVTTPVDLDCDGYRYYCHIEDMYGNELDSGIATLHVKEAPVLPQTGDSATPGLWLAMLLLGGMGLFMTIRRRRRA